LLIDTEPEPRSNIGGRVVEDGRLIFRFPDGSPEGQGAWLTVYAKGARWQGRMVTPTRQSSELKDGDLTWHLGPVTECPFAIVLERSAQPGPFRRSGLVRANGRSFVDDTGPFFPLGITFFWALYGWKFERERVRAHLQFISQRGYDYVRFLGQVDWPGEEIDPAWPDYEDQLAGLIDAAYDEYGLRVEVTLIGGGVQDPLGLATVVARVVDGGRAHKVLHLEAANEAFQNFTDDARCADVARYLRLHTPNLVATSAYHDFDRMRRVTADAGATLYTFHSDRTWGDRGWRQVRQAWDVKDFGLPTSHNEPPGPASTVATNEHPLQLAMMRALGILCGAGAYVLHVGAMVFGRLDPGRNRPANLWEVANIDAIMAAVRGVDRRLPVGIENWARANNDWRPPLPVHPLTADVFWEEGGPQSHGVNRNYAALHVPMSEFVSMPIGVWNFVRLTPDRAMQLEIFNPLTAELVDGGTFHAGEKVDLRGPEGGGLGAYIIRGRFI
jgi:hypothetical protein